MKLLSKYNRTNLIATTFILVVSAVSYYFLIRSVLISQLDKGLKVEEQEVIDFIKENDRLPETANYRDEQEEFFAAKGGKINRRFSSLKIFNKEENENISYRQLEFPVIVAGNLYKAQVRKSQEETDELILLILEITLGILLILLVTLALINRFLLSKLWKPFNTTLLYIKQFNLSGKETIKLEVTDISEFMELNEAISVMANRVSKDYREIKNFTEDASHEIQTPLAIIKSKMELLSQSENLREEQMNTIQSVYEVTNRLSRLNQSLILLTKIDNQQFRENDEVDISICINNYLNNYEELITAKLITITKNIQLNVKLKMNETLAEILISNLVTNAIKHNIDKGTIEIRLTKSQMFISNTGVPLNNYPLELFERFRKDKVNSDSLGLGLSIVKRICERYGFQISYNYSNLLHSVNINFV